MIDICFSDSVAGMLKCVKGEIKSDGIFSLWMSLNCGNLDCDDLIAQQIRIELEYEKYFRKDITEKEFKKEFEKQLKHERKIFEKLKKHVEDGHKIRLWLSNNANDRCGLFWLCNFLEPYTNELSLIVCPGYAYDDIANKVKENRNWAMLSNPWFMAEFINEAHLVCEKEKAAYSQRWDQLVEENAPLRILIDDVIVGVNEDFFDNAILSFVDTEPKAQNRIMGEMLGKWQSGDIYFISKRIECLIKENKIKVCEDKVTKNGCYWSRTIALV